MYCIASHYITFHFNVCLFILNWVSFPSLLFYPTGSMANTECVFKRSFDNMLIGFIFGGKSYMTENNNKIRLEGLANVCVLYRAVCVYVFRVWPESPETKTRYRSFPILILFFITGLVNSNNFPIPQPKFSKSIPVLYGTRIWN